jgi:outer membrane protein TolC
MLRPILLAVVFAAPVFLWGTGQADPVNPDTVATGIVVAIPGATAPLPLSEALTGALEANAGLQAQRQRLGELRGQMTQARAVGLPRLDLSGSWSRSRDPSFTMNNMFSGGGDEPAGEPTALDTLLAGFSFLPDASEVEAQTYWRASLDLHWEFRPTLVYNAVGAAGLGLTHQQAVLQDLEQRLSEGVQLTYFGVAKAGQAVEALEADLRAKEELLSITRRRFDLGMATTLDTLQAAVSLANLKPQIRSARQALRDTGCNLNVMMGNPPLTPLSIDTNIPLETRVIDPDLAVIRTLQRPDIRQVALIEKVLRKNRGAQRSDKFPYLSFDASAGYMGTRFDNLTDEGHDFWSTSLALNWPLFDGLLARGKVKETESAIRRTAYEKRDVAQQAILETHRALGDLATAHENLSTAEITLQTAGQALALTVRQYELGKRDYLSLLTAQSDHLMAQNNYIDARFEVLSLTATLKRVLGFDPALSLAEVAELISSAATASAQTGQGGD